MIYDLFVLCTTTKAKSMIVQFILDGTNQRYTGRRLVLVYRIKAAFHNPVYDEYMQIVYSLAIICTRTLLKIFVILLK